MNRNLKMLGLALLAAFAFGAIVAQGALAEVEHEFVNTNGATKAVWTGAQESGEAGFHRFTVNGKQGKCSVANLRGTVVEAEVDHVALHPEYKECTFNGVEMTVDSTGCTWTYDSETSKNADDGNVLHAAVSLSCSAGKQIRLTAAGCEIRVPPQSSLLGASYTNLPSHEGGEAITFATTLSTLTANSTGGFACFLVELGSGENHWPESSYAGAAEITGYADAGNGENEHEYTEGSQLEIAVAHPAPHVVKEHEFTTTNGVEPAVLTGTQETDAIVINGQSIECESVKLQGTIEVQTVDHIALHPTYTGCEISSLETEISTVGCTYTYDSDTFEGPTSEGKVDAQMEITCEGENEIHIVVLPMSPSPCKVNISPQSGLLGLGYSTVEEDGKGERDAVTVSTTVENLTATSEGGFLCLVAGLGGPETTYKNAGFTGSSIVTAYEDLGGEASKHEYEEGAQVDIAIEEG